MTFDPTKPVQTRNGRKARIICTDLQYDVSSTRILALITDSEGSEIVKLFKMQGQNNYGAANENDLINVPEKLVRYIGIWNQGYTGFSYITPHEARSKWSGYSTPPIAVARVEIEWTPGQFDE